MNLTIKLNTGTKERVDSRVVDTLYNLALNVNNTLDLEGWIETPAAYQDTVDYLNERFEPNLIIDVLTYYIRFADPEVVNVLVDKGVMQEGEGLITAQADELPTGGGASGSNFFKDNLTIRTFDEIKYFGRIMRGNYQIGGWFYGATNLESVNLTGMTGLSGYSAFQNCKNLEWFHGKDNLPKNTLNLEDLNWVYGNAIFAGCHKLYHITSLGNIQSMSYGAMFENCINLETVNLPLSCIDLSPYCFKNDSKLHTINLSHVTAIRNNVFEGCSSLEYCDGPNSTQGELNLPNLTGTLDNNAFKGCIKLTSIASLGSITSIGNAAFENCTNLATINFPNTITRVGTNAFNNTAWYNNQPDGPVYIAKVLYKCKNASGVLVIPNNIVSINEGAFYDCSSLTSVTIGSGVTSISINEGVFKGCAALSTIVVDSNNAKYDSRDNCNAIIETATNKLIAGCKNSTIPNNVTSIDVCAFRFCNGLTSITIPNSVTSIGNNAFYGCSGLTSVTIPNSVTSFGEGAFAYCTSLTSVTIPNSVISLSASVFSDCSGLTSVSIPDGVTSIGAATFARCTSLISITINAVAPPTLVANAFISTNNCPIYVPAGSVSAYQSASGWSTYASRIQAIPTT